jgi:DNA (cytosine-5)-methyltransferase 1
MGADDFVVKVPLNQAFFGFGDAVCVPAMEWIANNYLNRVWQDEFKPVAIATASSPATYRKPHNT